MRVITPPIKSQGIKTKLVPWIHALVPAVKGRWIEPFLGTGVVAFNSGFQEAFLSDIKFNLVTRDHFYHSGGKLENRRSVVEALVFNFPANIRKHNHEMEPKPEQMILLEKRAEYITRQVNRARE